MTQETNAVYRAVRDQLVGELAWFDTEQASAMVPSCPEWSVKDVVAHLSGLLADIRDEVPPPLGSPKNTSRQVNTRRDMTLGDICEEWTSNTGGMSRLDGGPSRLQRGLLADLVGHVYDLAEMDAAEMDAAEMDAAEMEGSAAAVTAPPPAALAIAAELYVSLLQTRAADGPDIALTVVLGDQRYEPASGTQPLTLQCTPLELVRSVSGRRTRAAVEGFAWTSDPAALLDSAFLQYGPFRTK